MLLHGSGFFVSDEDKSPNSVNSIESSGFLAGIFLRLAAALEEVKLAKYSSDCCQKDFADLVES